MTRSPAQAPDDPVPPSATDRSIQVGALLATFLVFVLIVGLPALLYAASGQTNVAWGLLALFGGMVVVSAYALREAVKAKKREME